jgi:hypothetical protein
LVSRCKNEYVGLSRVYGFIRKSRGWELNLRPVEKSPAKPPFFSFSKGSRAGVGGFLLETNGSKNSGSRMSKVKFDFSTVRTPVLFRCKDYERGENRK